MNFHRWQWGLSASFLPQHLWVHPLSSFDLCLSSAFKCSLVRYFSMRVSSLILTFSLISEISSSWKPILQVKTKSSKVFSILASVSVFLLPPGHLSPFPPLLHVISMSEFCHESFLYLWRCKSHDKFTWLPSHQYRSFLSLDQVMLNISSFGLFSLGLSLMGSLQENTGTAQNLLF